MTKKHHHRSRNKPVNEPSANKQSADEAPEDEERPDDSAASERDADTPDDAVAQTDAAPTDSHLDASDRAQPDSAEAIAASEFLDDAEWWNEFEDLQPGTDRSSMFTMVYPASGVDRNVPLESLWFRLTNPSFAATGIVPVPNVSGERAHAFALELARVGAAIIGQPVRVVHAIQLRPADAHEVVDAIREGGESPMLVVVDSPTFDTAAIPILRSCSRSFLLLELSNSESDDVAEILSVVGTDHVIGSVCLEQPRPRRFWQRARR